MGAELNKVCAFQCALRKKNAVICDNTDKISFLFKKTFTLVDIIVKVVNIIYKISKRYEILMEVYIRIIAIIKSNFSKILAIILKRPNSK